MTQPTVLLLPGLGNSGPDHWQTHWEAAFPNFVRVLQDDWDTPIAANWVTRLNNYINTDSKPKLLVAHSLACSLVAHWAHAHTGPVAAALLVAPSDVEASNYPKEATGFAPMPVANLPFKSIVVASDNDEYVPLERGRRFANAWGAEYILLSARGHLGSASRLGMWPEGLTVLKGLLGENKQ